MIKIHVISDLFLGFNEFSDQDENIPDVDLVILNGNLGMMKRGMLYAETLCKNHPDTQFVFNGGETEYHYTVPKIIGELDESMALRKFGNPTWPKNLHWSKTRQLITLRNNLQVDILCTYGYPNIVSSSIAWEDTVWFKNYSMGILDDFPEHGDWAKPANASPVVHGYSPIFATKDWINEQHQKEYELVKKWEIEETGLKILVTHINPYEDSRCQGQSVTPYKIHLKDGLWISSNTECDGLLFLGANLYSNPGRGSVPRGKIITVK